MGHNRSTIDGVLTLLNDKDGKDKSIKIIQYSAKLLVDLGSRPQLEAAFNRTGLKDNLNPLISGFSTFRKIIRLGNFLTTAREIQLHGWTKAHVIEYIDLYNEIFDDIYLLLKLGVVFSRKDAKKTKRWVHLADREANRAWLAAIFLNLNSEFRKRQAINAQNAEKKSQDALLWSNISIFKLFCDLIFCWIDLFETEVDPSVQIITGLLSGICGYCKTWHKLNK